MKNEKSERTNSGIKWIDGNSSSPDEDLMRLDIGNGDIMAELEDFRAAETRKEDGSARSDDGADTPQRRGRSGERLMRFENLHCYCC